MHSTTKEEEEEEEEEEMDFLKLSMDDVTFAAERPRSSKRERGGTEKYIKIASIDRHLDITKRNSRFAKI
jgi:hypothetical protein